LGRRVISLKRHIEMNCDNCVSPLECRRLGVCLSYEGLELEGKHIGEFFLGESEVKKVKSLGVPYLVSVKIDE
jgi:hypothetical protein